MLSHAKKPTTLWEAIRRFVALTMFVVFSMVSHHPEYAVQFDSRAHAAHADMVAAHHCRAEPCPAHHDGQDSCCAMGNCGVALPAPDCAFTPLALVSAYSHHPFEIAIRWANPRLDRPPKPA